jgi:hypothetical protein
VDFEDAPSIYVVALEPHDITTYRNVQGATRIERIHAEVFILPEPTP